MERGKEGAGGSSGGLGLHLLLRLFWAQVDNDRLAGGKRSLRKEGRGPPGLSSFSVPFLEEGSLGQDWQMWGVGRHNAVGSGNVRCVCIQVCASVQIRVNFKGRRAGGCE